jgi:hypothetical protein
VLYGSSQRTHGSLRTLQLAPSGMEREAPSSVSALASLPRNLACTIFARLPLRERARAALVCRAWRDVSYDASLWTRLRLPSTGLPTHTHDETVLLLGAVGRARGSLIELDLSGSAVSHSHVTQAILPALLALNARALRRLRLGVLPTRSVDHSVDEHWLRRVRAAAPGLETLEADVSCPLTQAAGVLDAATPRAPLRVRELHVTGAHADVAALAALAPALARHASLTHLTLGTVRLDAPGALDALADGGLRACRATSLTFARCSLGPPAVPALARLLAGKAAGDSALKSLTVIDYNVWPDPVVGDEAE